MNTFPQLAFTCPMNWETMRGNERERFCDQCHKTVHNLSRMTAAERAALLAAAQPGQLCVAYYQHLSARAPAAATRGSISGTLLKAGGAAAFIAAIAGVASRTGRNDTVESTAAREVIENAYYTARYQAEEWIDDVRTYFGFEPKYRTFMMGMVCEPGPVRLAPESLVVDPENAPPAGDASAGKDPE